MNDFLRQFVIESRELVDAAGDGLLGLERALHDSERLDQVFRAFHTLKGGAGIVEFGAMERAVHAAESILTEARTGERPLSVARIGHCQECLDQVLQWLDAIEQTEQLPQEADSEADRTVRRLTAAATATESTLAGGTEQHATQWLDEVLKKHLGVEARAAVRFVPDMDSFYQGEDPLGRMMSLPGLLALDLAPIEPWGPLDTVDPFSSKLILTALSTAGIADLEAHLQGHTGHCKFAAIPAAALSPDLLLPTNIAAVIKEQQALLREVTAENIAGRIASAGLVAANTLLFCGHVELSQRLSQATQRSLLEISTEPLQGALAQLLSEKSAAMMADPAETVQPPEGAARTLRIDAEQVDALVRLAGELTVITNAIGHVVKLARAGDPSVPEALKDRHTTLDHLIAELQRSVLQMRVRPLRAALRRFPRVTREMSASLGKAVRVVIEGDETEADKVIVEMLFEPLLHIVRNAIDHGVESKQDRLAAGKPATATLLLKAQRQGEQVLIEVSDDGAGINIARVREVALARGVVTEEQLDAMTETDVIELIFAPGFSTAAKLTQISGRGVGMDAVRKAVERIGGGVSVASRPGHGTSVTLALPFSVMMTHVMTVEAGGQMFGLPLEAIIETVRVPRTSLSKVGAASAVVVRNRTLPLIDLAHVLGIQTMWDDESEAIVVIAASHDECGAFRVDRIGERMHLILKPLEGLLAGMPGIVGTSLLGDGRVLLVLDVGEMLQ